MTKEKEADMSCVDPEDEYKLKTKKPYELEEWASENMKEFSQLLSDLENVDFKQKALWRQIYDNAITDRKNAYLMWTDLYIYIHGHEEQHFKHGQTAIKYLEKMEKSNEQILKLAALVEKAILKEVEEDFPSADEIFEKSEKKFKK